MSLFRYFENRLNPYPDSPMPTPDPSQRGFFWIFVGVYRRGEILDWGAYYFINIAWHI